jgi:guanosine-3',5'-bis(diphosphate) 3'-pyrophosphohydrolase
MDKLEKALMFAERVHKDQSYGLFPMMYHIKDVVSIARGYGFEEDVLVACALHDCVEDGDVTIEDIKTYFGPTIAKIVWRVTDEEGVNRRERKMATYPKMKVCYKAVLVKLCDRLSNTKFSLDYNNKRMFAMYQSELTEFKDNLYDPNMNVDYIWEDLKLMYKN